MIDEMVRLAAHDFVAFVVARAPPGGEDGRVLVWAIGSDRARLIDCRRHNR